MTQGQLLGVIGSGVFISFMVNVASDHWPRHKLEIASFGAFLAIMLFLAPSDGLLRRQHHGRARVVRLFAITLVVLYPLILWSVTEAISSYSAALIPNACLWIGSTVLLWTSSSRPNIGEFGMSVASLGGTISCFIAFRVYESRSEHFFATAYLLAGAGFVVLSIGLLKDRPRLLTIASLLFGVAAIFFSIPFLLVGIVIGGLAVQLSGLASAMFAFSSLHRRTALNYAALSLFSLAAVSGGGVILISGAGLAGSTLTGSGFMLLTTAFLLLIFTLHRRSRVAAACALACAAGAAALFGCTFLRFNNILFGIAVLLASSAMLLLAATVLVAEVTYRESFSRFVTWMLARPHDDSAVYIDNSQSATEVTRSRGVPTTVIANREIKPQDLRYLGLVVVVVAILAVGGGSALQIWRNDGGLLASTCLAALLC